MNPAKGVINVLLNKIITITFSEAIQASTAFNGIVVKRDDGVYKPVTRTINNNTLTLTFPYGLDVGRTYTIYIPIESVKDLTGNNLQISYNSTFTTIQHAATVAGINPTNGATNIPLNKIITITFSEAIQASTAFNGIVVKRDDGVYKPVTRTINNNTLTLTFPYGLDVGRTYTIYIPAESVKDLTGNNLQISYNSTFTTIY